MTTTTTEITAEEKRVKLLELELQEVRYRVLAVGALLCEPVSDNNLREAKKLLDPVYHDALAAHQIERMREPAERTKTLVADSVRWKMVEQPIIDWRESVNFPVADSAAQHEARQAMARACEAALTTIRRERERDREEAKR
jgi:hypothetical protein